MRTEDFVGGTFSAVLLAGFAIMFRGLRQPKESRKHAQWLSAGLVVMSFAFVAFGLETIYFVRTSARPQVEGNIWAVRGPERPSSGSDTFKITDDSGQVATIRCWYEGPGLREGDRARVRYVAYNKKLLDLTMLTGSYTGWHLQEPSGEWGGAVWVLLGLAWGFGGYREWRKAEPGRERVA